MDFDLKNRAKIKEIPPKDRVRLMCDLSNTALRIFLSSLDARFPNHTREERIQFLKNLVKERERIRRLRRAY